MINDFYLLEADRELRAAFRARGAITPATARPRKDLSVDAAAEAATFDNLLRRGVIREGAPGTFYLYENARPIHFWPLRFAIWIVVILLPVAIIQYCARYP